MTYIDPFADFDKLYNSDKDVLSKSDRLYEMKITNSLPVDDSKEEYNSIMNKSYNNIINTEYNNYKESALKKGDNRNEL